jgi:integrase
LIDFGWQRAPAAIHYRARMPSFSWARAFIFFHDKRHPSELGLPEVTHFLEHVVKTAPDPLPALAQARSALTLLYDGILGTTLGELPQPRPPRLLDQLRLVLRVRHYSPRTEDCYVQWARRFILSFEWQFVFASRQLSHCPRTGRIGRHHVLEGSLQRAVARAGEAAGLDRAIHCHTFRHGFATHLVERGTNIRSVQLAA